MCDVAKEFTICGSNEATEMQVNDINVIIPAAAIPADITAHIELGVTLHGPFTFPDNHEPVSPIIWICVKDTELQIPMKIRLPHMIVDGDGVSLSFAKAKHTCVSSDEKKVYCFRKIGDGSNSSFTYPKSEEKNGYGVLHVKHCCWYCIIAETTQDLALKKGYCLHGLIEKKTQSQQNILFICTYFLPNCFKVSTESLDSKSKLYA